MRPWSYSRLKTWEECPKQYQYSYIEKMPGFREPSTSASRGTEIHSKGEAYLRDELKIYPPEFQKVSGHTMMLKVKKAVPELKLAVTENWEPCDFLAPEAYTRVIIDIIYTDEDGTMVCVEDWKTGKVYDTHVDQLAIYVAIAAAHYPEAKKFQSRAVYIDQGIVAKPVVTPADRIKPLRLMWDGRVRNAEEDTIFPTRAGSQCKWCDYSKRHGGPCQF